MPPLQLVNFIVNRVKVIQEAFKLKVSMKTSKRTKYAKSIFFLRGDTCGGNAHAHTPPHFDLQPFSCLYPLAYI